MAAKPDSILDSTKKYLGLDPDYDVFDADIAMHINMVISVLRQAGFGPKSGLVVNGRDETWSQLFQGVDNTKYQMVKDYIYARVRLLFDPPGNSFGIEALKTVSEELLWRINFELELDAKPKNIAKTGGDQ